MSSYIRARVPIFLVGGAILVSACGGSAPAASTPTAAATAAPAATATAAPTVAPTVAPTIAPATPAPGLVVAHKAGEAHKLQPKRLESVVEIDMGDHFFTNAQGEKSPTFTLPAGKTVGIHIHNEGKVMHEVMIGRTLMKDGHGYETMLTELVPSDVFFYYGEVKAEVGGAMYGELEIEQGIRDVWIRLNVPANLKGEWEIGCFVPDHYEKGMHTKLIFQ